jgi:serine/threonine-protein kinase
MHDAGTVTTPDGHVYTESAIPLEIRSCGDYELEAPIAEGGMGIVWKARQKRLNRVVALKMIRAGRLAPDSDLRRFRMEAEAVAYLDHPHIVPIYEIGEADGQHYFSMKFVEGGPLSHHMSRFLHDHPAAARVVATAARAVHHAHERGILHRDLKPGNILLDGQGQPHVSDFGLAKRIAGSEKLTQTDAIVGTASYMAPEQARAERTLTPAVDVYGLGAVLYELLTGRPPFQAETPLDTVFQVLEREPEAPRRLNSRIDINLETICLKCLEKHPQRRYASAEALAEDLERWHAGEPILARPVGPLGSLVRWARRRPALAATIASISIFYLNYIVLLFLGKTPGDTPYLWSVTGLGLGWIGFAALFQTIGSWPRWRTAVIYAWAASDVMWFSILLLISKGPQSPLLLGYFLAIAGAGVRFRLALVWFVAILSALSYLGLCGHALWRRPEVAVDLRTGLIFVLGLLLMGLFVYLTLLRSRRAISTDW